MTLQTLINQSRLTLGELDEFLSGFLSIYEKNVVTQVVEEVVEENNDGDTEINLLNKQTMLRASLTLFEAALKRSTKALESTDMTELDAYRYKSLQALFSLIKSYLTDKDKAKQTAATSYNLLIDKLKGIGRLTNSEQSSLIANFVTTIQNDTYKAAFTLLKLEERAKDTKDANDEYIRLSKERTNAEKNRIASSSACRQQCVNDYRNLVSLINFAQSSNATLLYDEMIKELSARTLKAQELITRRTNAAAAKKKGEVVPKIQNNMIEIGNENFIEDNNNVMEKEEA